MHRRLRAPFYLVLAFLLTGGVHAQESSAAKSDLLEGHRLALLICSACHSVSADQPDPPILRPPALSFRSISKKPGATEQSLHSFILTTHSTVKMPFNMPNPQLDDDQAAAIVAYILSLKGRH